MELFRDFDISEETINKIENTLTNEEIENIECVAEKFYSSILYLRSINIKENVIEKIILENHEILIPGKEDLEKLFSKYEQNKLVETINNNPDYINYIYKVLY